ncbi:hypothetical protein yinte0001_13770 [Yersinia intermedia ATCC 29909]|nr:hypothetical protein yinte0001_13770 [Yersinia intermedia ATCC 29909]
MLLISAVSKIQRLPMSLMLQQANDQSVGIDLNGIYASHKVSLKGEAP